MDCHQQVRLLLGGFDVILFYINYILFEIVCIFMRFRKQFISNVFLYAHNDSEHITTSRLGQAYWYIILIRGLDCLPVGVRFLLSSFGGVVITFPRDLVVSYIFYMVTTFLHLSLIIKSCKSFNSVCNGMMGCRMRKNIINL